MKKILITGAAGFIGFHLTKKLYKKFDIIAIDSFTEYYDISLKLRRAHELKKIGIDVIKLDLNYTNELEILKQNKFDYIFHFAAQPGVRYSFEQPDSYMTNNILATFNLLELLKDRQPKHFIFSSTSSIYGYRNNFVPFKETDKSDYQISLYSSTKKSVESLLHNYSYNFGIPVSILRFFTVYGPWGRPDMALFKFIKSIISEEVIDVYNKGELWRDFTYIDDLIEAISRLINIIPDKSNRLENDSLSDVCPFRIVNIGNKKAINIIDFIKVLERLTNKRAKLNYLPMQRGDVLFTLADTGLLKRLTGYAPETSIEKGSKKFYDWYVRYINDNF